MAGKLFSLAKDTAVYGVSTVVTRFLTFFLTPIYTNYLTRGELGETGYLYAIIAFVNIVFSFGLDTAFMRFFKRDNPVESKQAFSLAFFGITILSGALTVAMLLLSDVLRADVLDLESSVDIVRMAAVIPFLDALMLVPFGLLRMQRKAKKFALVKIIIVIVNVSINLWLLLTGSGIEGVFIAGVVSSAVGVLLLMPTALRNLTRSIPKGLLGQMLRFGLPTVPSGFSSIVLQVGDRPLLKALAGTSVVAMYQANSRLAIPMMLFVSMFEYAWKPFYLNHAEDTGAKQLFGRVLTYFTLTASVVFLVTSLFIEYIVQAPFLGGRFINPQYWDGLDVIPIILAAFYLNGVYTNIAAGFHITKKTKYLPLSVGIAAIVSIAFNALFIPTLSYMAPAYGILAGYAAGAICLFYFSRKVFPISYEWSRIVFIVLTTALAYFACILVADELSTLANIALRCAAIILLFAFYWVIGFIKQSEKESIARIVRRVKRR